MRTRAWCTRTTTPLLQLDSGNVGPNGKPLLTFTLTNVGTGTARIVWLEMKLDGVAAPSMHALIRKLGAGAENTDLNVQTSGMRRGCCPRAARSMCCCGAGRRTVTPPDAYCGMRSTRRVRSYRSAGGATARLDVCRTSNLSGETPAPVDACDATNAAQLQG